MEAEPEAEEESEAEAGAAVSVLRGGEVSADSVDAQEGSATNTEMRENGDSNRRETSET